MDEDEKDFYEERCGMHEFNSPAGVVSTREAERLALLDIENRRNRKKQGGCPK